MTPWWTGDTLRVGSNGSKIAGHRAEALAAELGTPLYLHARRVAGHHYCQGFRRQQQADAFGGGQGRYRGNPRGRAARGCGVLNLLSLGPL